VIRPTASRSCAAYLSRLHLLPALALSQVRPAYQLESAKAVFHFATPENVVENGVSLAPVGSRFQIVSTGEKTLKSRVKFVKLGSAFRSASLAKMHLAGLAGVRGKLEPTDIRC
jgi:hypothetical protein